MRVIAGRYKSRTLAAPSGLATRPTSDRLRETLFSVLESRGALQQMVFADLFAGSGAVGIEALSRGAEHCLFVEKEPRAVAALKKNLAALDVGAAEYTVAAMEVATVLKKWPRPCTVVFLDPPYEDAESYTRTLHALGGAACVSALATNALVIAEHAAPKSRKGVADLADRYGALRRIRTLQQSDAALSFFELQND